MKTLKNTVAGTLLAVVAAGSLTSAYAADEVKTSPLKEARQEHKAVKSEWKAKHAEMKETRGENKDSMKENRQTWKAEHKDEAKEIFSGLSEADQEALKALRTEQKEATKALKETYSKDMTDEEKETLKAKMKELHDTHNTKTRELLSENQAALDLLDKKDELKEKNHELRQKNKEARKEYRGERSEKIQSQKTKFLGQIEAVLPKISDAKLEKINTRIASSIEKIEANESMDAERKAKYLDQLIGLKEIIEDTIESRGVETEDSEIDDIISEALN